jgi:pyruvate dehydrogenase kinase 2/3/4
MASSSFTRYSLKSLAELERSPQSSRQLLESVVERLHCQLASDFLTIPHHDHLKKKNKNVDTLVYIHRDTCRLAEQLLASQRPWQRFSTADQFLITGTFTQIAARHCKTLETVVQIVEQQQPQHQPQQQEPTPSPGGSSSNDDGDHDRDALVHDSAERFLQQRLGIQLLCHHYGELVKDRPGGAINQDLFLNDFIDDAISESKQIVEAHLGEAPSVHIVTTGPRVRTRFVQCWLQHSLVELLKNAMAAVVQQHRRRHRHHHHHHHSSSSYDDVVDRPQLPAIELQLDYTDCYAVIEIRDAGTGITDEQQVFRIGHTSEDKHWDRLDEQQSYAAVRSPLSSLGVGLTVARHQTEHFGGHLTLRNNNHNDDDHNSHDYTEQRKMNGCTARMELPLDDTLLERIPGQ